MKVIIPVAGLGTKLRPQTHTQPKALIPVAGKPILAHIIDMLMEGGLDDFIFITDYQRTKIEAFVKEEYGARGINISFVRQEPREGIGHAIWCAREFLKDDQELLIMLGDTILNLDLKAFLNEKQNILGTSKVPNPGSFGVVEINKEGYVAKLVEKPKIPKSNLAMVGIYKIVNSALFREGLEYITLNQVKTYGEYQLTDILMYMINRGEKFRTQNVDNWYDCGKKDSLLAANAIMLGRPDFHQTKTPKFPGTIIVPPVSIGNNCTIKNSIIGPHVAIGDNSTLSSSIIKNSIIGAFSEIQSIVLGNSIIGNDTTLKGISQSLNIGDNAEVNFSDK